MPDTQIHATDVIDLLLVQHAQIEELFVLAIGAEGPAKRDA